MNGSLPTPITVLFVDHATALGGAEHSLLLLLEHLDRTRVRPYLACPEGLLAQRARSLDVPVHPLHLPRLRRSPTFPLDIVRGARALVQRARQVDAHVIYSNTVRASLYAALAARLGEHAFLWHMRDFWLSESEPRLRILDRWGKAILCASATHVVANSQATARHLPCPHRVTVIYNGIKVEAYSPTMDGLAFRNRYGIPKEALVVGTVGRLRPWKGQDRFLRVLARVRDARGDVWGVIIGGTPFKVDDDYPNRLIYLTNKLGLTDRVVFTGHLADVRPALAAMDIFVHPGDPEPFGLAVLEAMAMARPVVAFAHGALPEIVVDGKTGILVSPGDEHALAEAVINLAAAPDRRVQLGRAARQRAESLFTIERTASALTQVLTQLVTLSSR